MGINKGKFFIRTFGCQMNAHDAERIAGLLRSDGYSPASAPEDADLVYVHTCAVRDRAEQKLRSTLSDYCRLKKTRPNVRVGVGGCVAQLRGASLLQTAPEVDFVVGPRSLSQIPSLLSELSDGEPIVRLDAPGSVPSYDKADTVAHSNPVRAYVTVMEGCNHVCAFCVVPRTRGPEVCRPVRDIVSEVKMLVARGYQEILLLGQTVNAYQHGGADFAALLGETASIPGLQRLRFTTSHPNYISNRMIDLLALAGPVCPYLHLPFQSGANRILDLMRRGYTIERYLELVSELRERCPQIAISTDVIVGYPSESEADFSATVDVIRQVGFDNVFSFTYSSRPGTTAARLVDDVPVLEKRRRLHALNLLQQEIQHQANRKRIGATERILVEEWDPRSGLMGRTPQFRIVHAPGEPESLGRLTEVEITRAGANSLSGVVRSIH
jgi:tRNA-2-methylthio-N6-dimethylallyladenosine synthase